MPGSMPCPHYATNSFAPIPPFLRHRPRHFPSSGSADLQKLIYHAAAAILLDWSSAITWQTLIQGWDSRIYRASILSRPQIDENGASDPKVITNYAEILVVRHGETEWNAERRLQGQLDVDLNDVGRQQAFAVAERLSKEPKISAVYSSDLKRASDTAEIIAKCCGVLEVIKVPHLRERHLGDLQGLVFHEAAKVKPHAYKAFSSNKDNQEIPGGGESFDQLYDRCTTALERIAKKHMGDRIVIVSHGGAIRALHGRVSTYGHSAGKVLNTSVNIFLISDDGDWSIKSWNDVSHLKQAGFLDSGFGGDRNSG